MISEAETAASQSLVYEFYDQVFNRGDNSNIDRFMRDDVVYVFFKCTLNNSHVNKVCDIHRLQDGQLAEYRDIVEHNVEDVQSRNGNGLF